jgi:hypothetical protein
MPLLALPTSLIDKFGLEVSQTFGLTKLPPHFGIVVYSATLFQALEFICGPVSSRLFGKRYDSLKRKEKRGWAEHVVSLVHSATVIPLALNFTLRGSTLLTQDKAFGWDPAAGPIFAFSVG